MTDWSSRKCYRSGWDYKGAAQTGSEGGTEGHSRFRKSEGKAVKHYATKLGSTDKSRYHSQQIP